MASWDQVLGQILMVYRCCLHISTGESSFFLGYNRDPVLPVYKLITPVQPYKGKMTIAKRIGQQRVVLNTAAKMLTK